MKSMRSSLAREEQAKAAPARPHARGAPRADPDPVARTRLRFAFLHAAFALCLCAIFWIAAVFGGQPHALLFSWGAALAGSAVLAAISAREALWPLRDAIGAKRRFAGYAIHELRAPIAACRSAVDAALISPASGREQALEGAAAELDRAMGILANLEILSDGAQKIPMRAEPINLRQAVENALRPLRPAAQAKEIALDVLAHEGIHLHGNPAAIDQVLGNLVRNAIAYTPACGVVTVMIREAGEGLVELRVDDSGRGIPADILPRVFEPYVRGNSSASETEEGKGLGLSIVRDLVRAHGGEITMQSAEGKGTSVVVWLPKAPPGGLHTIVMPGMG